MTTNNKTLKTNLLVRYPLISFFALSYILFIFALMIIGIIISLTTISPFVMSLLIAFGSWTPNLAAIIITGINGGKAEVKKLFAGWLKWRVNLWWYVFSLAPIVVALGSAGLYALSGKPAPGIESQLTIGVLVSMLFFHTIQGATGEELGWRGFALPRLQERFSSLVSALILGLVISGWHGLLHLVSPIGIPEWQFWLMLISYSVIITWAYNKTGGSILIATIFHFAFNFGLELVATRFGLVPLENLVAILTAIYTALAVLLVLITGTNLSKKKI
ncbi:MAG: CPBP family intramembrane metalloprotease [Anaerolineaceae bacterium]|nr:CPBP family intramembrane metalloprotease [Anaerolineaceae bacterium]